MSPTIEDGWSIIGRAHLPRGEIGTIAVLLKKDSEYQTAVVSEQDLMGMQKFGVLLSVGAGGEFSNRLYQKSGHGDDT